MSSPEPSADPVTPRLPAAPRSSLRLVSVAACAGLLAGLASWMIGELTVTAFRPPLREVKAMGVTMMLPTLEDEVAADTKNAALTYGVLGACLAVALGLSGGWLSGSTRRGLRAAALGVMLGAAAGAIASVVLLRVYFTRPDTGEGDLNLTLPLLCHGGIWGAVGAAAGLAFGMGLGGRGRAAQATLGGLVGGFAGAGLYEIVGAMLLPFAKTVQPIAISPNARLLAHLAVAVLVGVCAAVAVGERRRRSATPPTATD